MTTQLEVDSPQVASLPELATYAAGQAKRAAKKYESAQSQIAQLEEQIAAFPDLSGERNALLAKLAKGQDVHADLDLLDRRARELEALHSALERARAQVEKHSQAAEAARLTAERVQRMRVFGEVLDQAKAAREKFDAAYEQCSLSLGAFGLYIDQARQAAKSALELSDNVATDHAELYGEIDRIARELDSFALVERMRRSYQQLTTAHGFLWNVQINVLGFARPEDILRIVAATTTTTNGGKSPSSKAKPEAPEIPPASGSRAIDVDAEDWAASQEEWRKSHAN